MPDDLSIGSTSVATDELYERAELLRVLAQQVVGLRGRMASVDRLLGYFWLAAVGAPADAARAELDIDQVHIVLAELEVQARALAWALGSAADGYGFVERFIGHLGQELSGDVAALAGKLVPGLLLSTAGAGVLGAAGGIVAASGQVPGGLGRIVARAGFGAGVPDSSPFAREHNETLTNPFTVGLVSDVTHALGVASLTATGLPMEATPLLGAAGVAVVARGALAAGSTVGLVSETRVRLSDEHTLLVDAAPVGFADRLSRVPDPDHPDTAQVVVERYSTPGEQDRFGVFVTGTVTFSPVADSEPWDTTSNLSNAAGTGGGSYAAVSAAMELAGVDASSPVQFTGYSQGGATAARLAASGDWNTQGLATFGGPTGQVAIPGGFPTVIVEHTDDLVPALGGHQLNHEAVIVRRDVFGAQVPEEYAVPAHHLEYYERTATLMDGASDPRLKAALAELDTFGAAATTVTSTAYRFDRIDPLSGPTSGGR
jgi:hypothetical protein